MAPVSIYSWRGNRDELRRVKAVKRHLRWVGVDLRHIEVVERYSLWHLSDTGTKIKTSGLTWDELRWIRIDLSDIGTSTWRRRGTLRVTIAKCNDLLWVRNISYEFEKFLDIWATSGDSLSWLLMSDGELETFDTGWNGVALDLLWIRGIRRNLQSLKTYTTI